MVQCQKRKTGFTLIELVVVLSIVGALIIVGVIGIREAQETAQDSEYKEWALQLSQSLQEYNSENGVYPYVSCPVAGGGFDQLGSIANLIPNPGAGGDLQAYNDYTTAYNSINKVNAVSSYGYCSLPSGGSGANAFILIVKTITPQSCKDSSGNNYFLLGYGSWDDGALGHLQYDSIPTQDLLTDLTGVTGFGLSCFQT